MTLAEVKYALWCNRLTKDEAWEIGMDHPDWDTGAAIRGLIIDLNEAEEDV
jgi:hypothetical protein